MLEFITFVYALFYACTFGSFLANTILNQDLKKFIQTSCCPHCHHRLFYHDLIPVLSWILLKGRCRYCKEKISIRYPIIELSTTFCFMIAYHFDGWSITLILDWLVLSALIRLSWIDLDYMIIPTSSILFILGCSILQLINKPNLLLIRITHSIIFCFLLFLFAFVTKALGYGDIQLIAVSILYLGLNPTIVALVLSCFIASILEGFKVLILKKLPTKIPFGPYLAIGIFLVMFYYDLIIQTYFKMIGI